MTTEGATDDTPKQAKQGLSVHFRVTLADALALLDYSCREIRPARVILWIVVVSVPCYWVIYCVNSGTPLLDLWGDAFRIVVFVFVVLSAVLSLFLVFYSHTLRASMRRRFHENEKRGLNELTISLSDHGFTVAISDKMKFSDSWKQLKRIIRTKAHIILVYLGNRGGIAVPKTGFASDSDFDKFWQTANDHLTQATGHHDHRL